MKNALLILLTAGLLASCAPKTETTTTTDSTTTADDFFGTDRNNASVAVEGAISGDTITATKITTN